MKLKLLVVSCVLVLLCLLALPLVSQKAQQQSAVSPSPDSLERGKYLVEQVGLCNDCHSPRNEKGAYIEGQQLMGAPIMFKPSVPMPWAEKAPRLAGLPGWSDEAIIKFLTTGETLTGVPARPPMPPYRFNREDAMAVTAYLRSLDTESKRTTAEKKPAR